MRTVHHKNKPLRLASVEITRRCNNRCVYCEHPKAEEDLHISQFSELLDELVSEGFEAVALGGGEPTLHPELPDFLEAIRGRGLKAGLTTNARDPEEVLRLADAGLLDTFGISAGKGIWQRPVAHPAAVVNLLLLQKGLVQVMKWATESVRLGAGRLLLLGYKGSVSDFTPTTDELSEALLLLTCLGKKFGTAVAADDYTRRRLGLTTTCGEGFRRIDIYGRTDFCCFPECEYSPSAGSGNRPLISGNRPLSLPKGRRTLI